MSRGRSDTTGTRLAPSGQDGRARRIGLMDAHRLSPVDDNDFYPTPPWAARAACEHVLRFDPQAPRFIAWESACGAGHFVHGARDYFPRLFASDAYDYGWHQIHDFLGDAPPPVEAGWIIGNPPFGELEAWIRRAWALASRGVALVVRMAAAETIGRFPLLYHGETPLTVLAQFIERVPMHKGRYEVDGSTAAFYTLLVFLKPALRPRRLMVRFEGRWYPGNIPIEPGAEKRLFRPDDAVLFGARAA